MSSFSSLYADMHLCILGFLAVRDLTAMVRSCKSLGAVVARVHVKAGLELRQPQDGATGQHLPLPLPEPHWLLHQLVTSVGCRAPDLLPACPPFTLRQRCPGLNGLSLHFSNVDATLLEELLEAEPPSFWPVGLEPLSLDWFGAYCEVESIADLTDQLRSMCGIAARIPSLTCLSLYATGHLTIREEEETLFRNEAPFPPCLGPLLQLHLLRILIINVELQTVDPACGNTSSRWVSDADCSVICSLPSLCDLDINDGHLSRDGLLPHLIHSDEADALRHRLQQFHFGDWTADDETSATPALFKQLQRACPLMAAALPPDQQ